MRKRLIPISRILNKNDWEEILSLNWPLAQREFLESLRESKNSPKGFRSFMKKNRMTPIAEDINSRLRVTDLPFRLKSDDSPSIFHWPDRKYFLMKLEVTKDLEKP